MSADQERQHSQQLRRKKYRALLLAAPLLLFILISFIAPIGNMLFKSIYQPTVVELIPDTSRQLEEWDSSLPSLPPEAVFNQLALELQSLAKERQSGKLAAEINRLYPGAASLINASARKLRRVDSELLASGGQQQLIALNSRWQDPALWRAIKTSTASFSANYYLTAFDLQQDMDGNIVARDTQIYRQLYIKSLTMALTITLLTALIAFPLAYYLAHCSSRKANLLLVFVLLPFWTSLLVRTTAWIALLQTNGVVNSVLMGLNIIAAPLDMLYTEFSTVVAMTHILLPFMILPLYSVMKSIDPSYYQAALSLGASPGSAFCRVYLPMTLPGISAGTLLVFIISIGYYITPALVGGTDGQMIGNLIAFHMQSSNNWELAAALGSILLVLILTLYWLYDRLVGIDNLKLG